MAVEKSRNTVTLNWAILYRVRQPIQEKSHILQAKKWKHLTFVVSTIPGCQLENIREPSENVINVNNSHRIIYMQLYTHFKYTTNTNYRNSHRIIYMESLVNMQLYTHFIYTQQTQITKIHTELYIWSLVYMQLYTHFKYTTNTNYQNSHRIIHRVWYICMYSQLYVYCIPTSNIHNKHKLPKFTQNYT